MLTPFRRLPLFTALAAFILYACTMGGGLTFNGLTLAAKLAGWDDTPLAGQPLLWLLTLPLQLLPAAWVPLALKLLAAVLAAAVLGLLTRTVQLLPWDHPWDNASRLACALPILTACALCALEFSFWQEATTTCGELLDLLLLAAVIWLLLEYQVRRQPRWLDAATVLWGLGMAENWVMLFALPLFVVTVIWLERLRFFRWVFILRLTALGLAGFAIYAVQPTVNGLLPRSPWTLEHSWAVSLHATKSIVLLLYYQFWKAHRLLVLVVAICFLVPTLPLLVRMRDEGTHNKSGADRFQTWLYRSLRLGLLLACFWLAFDPIQGARYRVQQQLGLRLPLLTFDYLNALGAAFLMGNLLLITQTVVRDEYRRRRSKLPWQRLAVPVAAAVLVVAAAGLAVRNAPAIVHGNFRPLEEFGEAAVKSLPAGRGVMLSDADDELAVFQAALARHGMTDWLAVDTRVLPSVSYRARLEQRQPAGWLTGNTRHELNPLETLQLLEQVARTNRLFYLHPSYGYFFEGFYTEPTGAICGLKLRGKDPLVVPPLLDAAVDSNEQFWTSLWDHELAAFASPPHHSMGWMTKMTKFGLTPAPGFQDHLLGEWFSIPLEGWAVTLQKQGRLREARIRASQALQLNSNNVSARLTLDCNTNLQAGLKMGLADVETVTGQLGSPDRVNVILTTGGPFDQPAMCYVLGHVLLDHGLVIQAVEQLERVRVLAPRSPAPELMLAEIYNRLHLPDRSLPLINHVREEIRKTPANSSLDLDLALLEFSSSLLQTNMAGARDALRSVVRQHPDDPQIASRVASAYLAINDATNALQVVDGQLAKTPDDPFSLNTKAAILIQTGHAAGALPILDRVLVLTNLPAARINRAFARLATQDYASARGDLQELEKNGEFPGMVNFGLALMAEHGSDTNSARNYLQLCLSNTPPGAPLWYQANAHLQRLKSGAVIK